VGKIMGGMEFWYEFGSSYSYPAVMRIERLAREAGVEVRWRPFLLGPIFQTLGWNDSPFNIFAAKGRYMWRDLERVCEAEGLPLRLPPVKFPQNGLKAARIALVGVREGWTPAFTCAVFAANYAEQKDISDEETLRVILGSLGIDADAALEAANTPDNKDALRRQTEEAASRGLFGAPSYTVDEELFWGNDRLEAALAWAKARF
jgi:2-hydroxychromene-2-carboxylate isomerase